MKDAATDDRALGVVLLIVGSLVLLIKFVPWITVTAVLSLWPLALIYLGVRMIRRSTDPEPPGT